MADESLETLFGSCVLEILALDTSISFPEDVDADDWLRDARKPGVERSQAFFDEQLNLFLAMHVGHPALGHPGDPPRCLVDFLGHVQIALEASYISQTPNHDPATAAISAPPRTSSAPKGRPPSLHPSIFPPNTPNPIPSTTESDRKYIQSEGTLLFSGIWGTKRTMDERFALLFSEAQSSWIAVYELSLVVSFLRVPFSDPLLCLTASATLRDKALSLAQSTHPLVAYLVKKGIASHLDPGVAAEEGNEDEEPEDTVFEEINLLEGLTLGPGSEALHLPSTRLGNATRRRHFSLPPVSATVRTPPSTTKQGPNHVLRKSYRKILQTVSGFRVRMRTVFIPHVLLPKDAGDQDAEGTDGFENGDQEREAGNSERTVVLCVEVENSGESGPAIGFSLEHLDVKIGGEGATTRLIGWGECAFDSDVEKHLFPFRIRSMEQYNLLYVVSFWNTPNDQENLLLAGHGTLGGNELQRAVTITVYGKPYLTSDVDDEKNTSYPTQTFSSRWNCILDLSSRREEAVNDPVVAGRCALPEPASPFPGLTALSSFLSTPAPTKPIPQAIAGKRHTLPGSLTALRTIHPPNARLSLPQRDNSPGPATATSYTPPSVALQAFNRSGSTTFGALARGGTGSNPSLEAFVTPPTPAYPAFSPVGGTGNTPPHIHALGSQPGYLGPTVEIRRDRGTSVAGTVPQTPIPTVSNTAFGHRQALSGPSGEPIVVSVGLLPAEVGEGRSSEERMIYPSDQFTLDIFVYNQSSWTRRFEVGCPNLDRRHRTTEQSKAVTDRGDMETLKAAISPPGILPLQNRIRVGPLRPSACQSVRMDFLAISPGIHSVDVLTLTDVESGYLVNLRSVMDIVVHERIVQEKEAIVS